MRAISNHTRCLGKNARNEFAGARTQLTDPKRVPKLRLDNGRSPNSTLNCIAVADNATSDTMYRILLVVFVGSS